MRFLFNLFLVLVCVAFVWGGGGNTYVALTNTKPTAVTCTELLNNPPSAKWLEIRECTVNIDDIVEVKYKSGTVEGYYAPLVPTLRPGSQSAVLVKAESIKELRKLAQAHEFSGIVQFGIESDDSVREIIENAHLNLSKKFLILDAGEKPELAVSMTMLSMGLLIGWYLWRKVSKVTDKPAGVESAEASLPPMASPSTSKTKSEPEVLEPVSR